MKGGHLLPGGIATAARGPRAGRALLASALIGVSGGCTDAPTLPRPQLEALVDGEGEGAPCRSGESRACAETVDQVGNRLSCYEGVEVCSAGQWGPCQDGTVVERVGPDLPLLGSSAPLRARASAPTTCNPPWVADPSLANGGAGGASDGSFGGLHSIVTAYPWYNPCDPTCRYFTTPPALVPDYSGGGAGPGSTWQEGSETLLTGRITALPPDVACAGDDLCDPTLGVRPAACHPCVDTVCLADPYCCATDWDQTCVDKVYTLCAGVPAPPTASVCEYAVYSETTLHLGNRVDIKGMPVGARGALTLDDAEVDGAISATGRIELRNNSKVRGDATAATTVDVDGTSAVWGTRAPGVATTMQSVPDKGLACPGGETDTVEGTGEVKTITPGNYGTITVRGGRTLVLDGAGTYNFERLHFDDGSNSRLVLPATGTVIIDTCAELYLGNYLELRRSDGAGGSVPLTPAEALRLLWYTEATTAKIPTDMAFFGSLVAPNASVQVFSRSPVYGLLYAQEVRVEPDIVFDTTFFSTADCQAAGIDLGGTAAAAGPCPVGLAQAATPDLIVEPCRSGLDCQSDHRCTQVATDAACGHAKCEVGSALDATCDPCVGLICAADPTCCSGSWTASCVARVKTDCDAECDATLAGGRCVPNDPGYQDTAVGSGIDLSLGVPCADTIPVCNHGADDAPPGVQLTAWALSARQVSVVNPDMTLAAGHCTTTEPIPAGECRSVSCNPALLDRDLTVMVNPEGALPEYSRLDNWTGYVDGASCDVVCVGGPPCAGGGGVPVPTTFPIESYQATCPPQSGLVPQWYLMVWSASDLGAGKITFEARTASTAAELAAAPWATIASAESTPVDTAECPKLVAPPDPRVGHCPVFLYDTLTTAMGPGSPKHPFLDLRISMDPDPTTFVSLDSWELSYTCRYAE